MLRLFRVRKFPLFNPQMMSYSFNTNILTRTCSFCNHRFTPKPINDVQNLQVSPASYLSTSTHTAVHSALVKKKKKRRTRKKYAELLEVTGSSTSERKASVSKLRPKHLSLLAEQPGISLSQLYALKKLSSASKPAAVTKKQTSTSNIIPSVSDASEPSVFGDLSDDKEAVLQATEMLDLPLSELHNELVEELGVSLEHSDHEMEEHSEVSETFLETSVSTVENEKPSESTSPKKSTTISYKQRQKEKMAKVKWLELERAGREESLTRSLLAYLELCVSCGLLNRGLATLLFYRNRHKANHNQPQVKEIKLFNILMHGFASKGNLNRIRELLQILREDNIDLTVQTYAACFECVGRMPDDAQSKQFAQTCNMEMQELGFSFNDIMQKCIFVADQRETVLQAIQRIDPDFVPVIPPPDTCYSCSLLLELNKTSSTEKANYKSPAHGLISITELQKATREQLDLELNNYVKVRSIEKRSEPTDTIRYYRKKLDETLEIWRKAIGEAFQRDIEVLRVQHQSFKSYGHINLYPYLKVLDPSQYTELILQEIRKLAEGSETFSPTVSQLHRSLGLLVRNRYLVKYKKDVNILTKIETLYGDYCKWYLNPSGAGSRNTREHWQHLIYTNQSGPDVNVDDTMWPTTVINGVGKFLYNIILRDIKIDVNLIKSKSKNQHFSPAFYTVFRNQKHAIKEEIKPHPILSRLFRGAAQEELVFEVTTVPMLCPPVPWTSVNSGGYLLAKADIIRLPQQAVQQRQRLVETSAQQLYPAFDSLNQLGAVPWIVNKPVLDVILQVFNDGGSHRLDIPEPPSACPPPDAITPQMTKFEKFQVHRQRAAIRRRKAEMYSLWCDALYRLSLANHFRDKVFWLPHNMDFRGRVYPCPPHLNHLGSDMARALLCFAKGEPLGPNGFNWLKIHLVNLTGLKKREPLSKRLQYANKIMPEIIDSAENPLTGRMWWAQSEEPWQTLACCFEIANVLKSGNPEEYICRFPVHQDGSCNGLQHYAALGRDKVGAESVNLSPASQPQDVYSCVAALVERERLKDAAAGVNIAQVLEGFIQRKVIKQTVMTTVYGVTKFGARLQIARQLKDIDNFPKEHVWKGSTYLVTKTFESLREMFTSTKEIQDWFTDCARLISQVCGQNVEWVTPLGLPIVQPYNRFNKKLFFSNQNNKLQEHFCMDSFERPNVMKQKNAFPPNFIHSLDSSHMMLTSLFCEREGISFVSVHDCYWTHPSTVDIMNKICRKQFVALHSEPILEDLSLFLSQKYSYSDSDFAKDGSATDMAKLRLNKILKKLPTTGDFQLENVLDSVYFFS
ncbi:DNA-directed RNA polymerase, mitochondrial [Anabrus simplex]|uniref:DNA-directed RNA polymerase, mitochondrial n=1 Tax=Anabrus simplex TaxID=316456 RepID=UPI0035A33180